MAQGKSVKSALERVVLRNMIKAFAISVSLIGGAFGQVIPSGDGYPKLNTVVSVGFHEGNLIANGSFESGASGWDLAQCQIVPRAANTYAYSGRDALNVLLNPVLESGDFVKAPVARLKPGTQYTLSFYYRTNTIPASRFRPVLIAFSGLDDGGTADNSAPYLQSQSQWTLYQHTFTTSSQAFSGEISLIRGNSYPQFSTYRLEFDDVVLVEGSDPLRSKIEKSIAYLDGMNRPIQTMKEDLGLDIYGETSYDPMGRVSTTSLPISMTGGHSYMPGITYGQNGTSKLDLFYGPSAPPAMNSYGYAYTQTLYEQSPLGRVKRVFSPGGDWGPDQSIRKHYGSTEGTLPYDWPSSLPLSETGTKKFVEMSLDEQGNASRQYKDLFGRVVLQESKLGNAWVQTVNQYDGMGNLVSETAPNGPGGANIVTTHLYNTLGQQKSESSPDVGLNTFVYDLKGNLRFSQTSEQLLKGRFTYLKYDRFNRVIESGEILNDDQMNQPNADNPSFPFSNLEKSVRLLNFYDQPPVEKDWCLENVSEPTFFVRNDANLSFANEFFDLNSAYSAIQQMISQGSPAISKVKIYVVMDPPLYSIQPMLNSQFTLFTTAGGVRIPFGLYGILRSGQEFQNLFGAPFPFSVNWGPLEGRLVQTVTCNAQLAGTPIGVKQVSKTFNYDKFGNVVDVFEYNGYVSNTTERWQRTSQKFDVRNRLQEKKIFSIADGTQVDVGFKYTYDHLGRPEKVSTLEDVTVIRNYYNDLGQLRSKEVGVLPGRTKIDYTYNFRGWLKEIEAKDVAGGTLFKQTLKYQDGDLPRYDGNISEFTYQNLISDNTKYSFEYDELSRLVHATSLMASGASSSTNQWTYDYHDNGAIDGYSKDGQDFDYHYYTSTNQLEKIAFTGNHPRTFGQQANFSYDASGRMKSDKSKNLNLSFDDFNQLVYRFSPSQGAGTTVYSAYDAEGKRVSRIHYANVSFVDGKHYWHSGKETQLIGTGLTEVLPLEGAGRITFNGSGERQYEAYIGNHLGSTMKVHNTNTNQTVYKTDYDPYGNHRFEQSTQTNLASITEKFTGKEKDEVTALNYFGARYFDPEIMLWISPDPAREFHSPYAYSPDPINGIDPDGRDYTKVVNGLPQRFTEYDYGHHEALDRYRDGMKLTTVYASAIAAGFLAPEAAPLLGRAAIFAGRAAYSQMEMATLTVFAGSLLAGQAAYRLFIMYPDKIMPVFNGVFDVLNGYYSPTWPSTAWEAVGYTYSLYKNGEFQSVSGDDFALPPVDLDLLMMHLPGKGTGNPGD